MKVKRNMSTEARVNQLLSKDEPTWQGHGEVLKMDMVLALNWYSQHKDSDASHKYLNDYCKAQSLTATEQQINAQASTLGFICRMVSRGALLRKEDKLWFRKRVEQLTQFVPQDSLFIEPKASIVAPVKQVTIQDRLKEKSSKCIGLLEGAVDELILSDFKKTPNTLELMRTNDIKGAHGPAIVNFFKKWRDEFRVAIAGKDEQINEAYSNYTLPQMKKMEALYDQIISDALTVMGDSLADRSPRKKKLKSPEVQVKKLKFCAEDTTLGLKSVPPTRMIGAEGVWVYQRKNRLLSYYAADDASGLGCKGCKVLNYSKSKSRSKKLRKPEQVLPQIVNGGKVALKKIFDDLTTKDAKLSGRLGSETLLVRVII